MAKGPIMFSKASGKLGNMVLSVNKGQQIAREYVAQPANPRTNQQMGQRIPFAACALFYKRATQAFFKFAFEGKKTTESDYNAFMRVNMRETEPIYPYKEEAENPNFPLVNDWVMTQGSLPSVTGEWRDVFAMSKIKLSNPDAYDWTELLNNNPDFQMGDIITFCLVTTDAYHDIASGRVIVGTTPPRYIIKQLIVGADLRGGTIGQYLTANGLAIDSIAESVDGIVADLDQLDVDTSHAGGFVFVHSRPTSTGLKVSTEKLNGNTDADIIFEVLFDQQERALPSWQATGDAILQGDAAEPAPVAQGTYDAITASYEAGFAQGQQKAIAAGFSLGAFQKGDMVEFTVTFNDSITQNWKCVVGGNLVGHSITIVGGTQTWRAFADRGTQAGAIQLISPKNLAQVTTAKISAVKVNGVSQSPNA